MIYVDDIQTYPHCKLAYKRWCHMATDGDIEELHAMAEQLGLRRAWFQRSATHPHYDLVPSKRALALKLGAIPVSTREMIQRCHPQMVSSEVRRE